MGNAVRQKVGAVVFDLPRFLWAMRSSPQNRRSAPWIFFHNRRERLTTGSSASGASCDWQWTTDLNIAKVFPSLGSRLRERALRDWPIKFAYEPQQRSEPTVSFIIGHRGKARLPHLLITLETIAAQRNASFECMVVEQSEKPEVMNALPSWVRYVHTPLPRPDMPYSRSWAFNVGARNARSELLIMHDNDMLVPESYAAEVVARFKDGNEVINLKRFIFYQSEEHTSRIISGERSLNSASPLTVVQNLEAGGSLAISKDAHFRIGGFDESFVGWGGEDNEFWERAQTQKVWPYGYLPLVHLWHEAQPEKHNPSRFTATLLESRSSIPPAERIRELTGRCFGSPTVE
jgi:hypothetical protein